MFRRQFLIGVGATLITGGLTAGCGSPTSPGGVTPPPPDPQPQPPPPVTPPSSSITRVLAFGDSMTAGTVSPTLTFHALDAGKVESYPFKLLTLLAARYAAQTISVFNAGQTGEQASAARSRLARSISEATPDLVLLMEGANDLNSISGLPSTNAGVDSTVAAMEDMVRDTVGRGIPVLLATLPAQRPPKGSAADLLPRYNDGLKTMAAKKGATIVDVNALLSPSLIGQDGLHPSEPGYQRLAEIILDAIKQKYEVSASIASR
jgi:lysophospholipase L1-like esterase